MQSKLKIGNFTREKSALVLKTKKKKKKKTFFKKALKFTLYSWKQYLLRNKGRTTYVGSYFPFVTEARQRDAQI